MITRMTIHQCLNQQPTASMQKTPRSPSTVTLHCPFVGLPTASELSVNSVGGVRRKTSEKHPRCFNKGPPLPGGGDVSVMGKGERWWSVFFVGAHIVKAKRNVSSLIQTKSKENVWECLDVFLFQNIEHNIVFFWWLVVCFAMVESRKTTNKSQRCLWWFEASSRDDSEGKPPTP